MANGVLPDRLVLRDVPKVSFYSGGPRCPEDIPFPSVMRALLEYLKDEEFGCRTGRSLPPNCKVNCSYSFFVGVSGAASFLSWKPGWADGNAGIEHVSDDPEAPLRRAFEAAGYEFDIVHAANERDDRARLRDRVAASIVAGRPVLGFGIVGPPEACLVTGYDSGGDTLIGWSFFQGTPPFNDGVEFEPTGEFRRGDWYHDRLRLILVGQKRQRPPLAGTFRGALEWMLKVARTPATSGDRHTGLAAYSAWAEHLLRDDDFPNDEAVLRQRHEVHDGAVGLVAEARWYGSQFLLQACDGETLHYGLFENLVHAAACYAAEHDLMWKLWGLVGGIGNPEAYRRFADPAVRRQMVPIVREARDKDAQAAEHIVRALAMSR
jgi:hypothetical protein